MENIEKTETIESLKETIESLKKQIEELSVELSLSQQILFQLVLNGMNTLNPNFVQSIFKQLEIRAKTKDEANTMKAQGEVCKIIGVFKNELDNYMRGAKQFLG